MARFLVRFCCLALVALLIPGLKPATPAPVIAHEWGTFTTVAAQDGRSRQWLPLGGAVDLPCFVNVLGGNPSLILGKVAGVQIIRGGAPQTIQLGAPGAGSVQLAPTYEVARQHLVGTVRMETPVIYFYSQQRTDVSVTVDFPNGLVTEWYPPAKLTHDRLFLGDSTLPLRSSISWPLVSVQPGTHPSLPREQSPSHYYPARQTEAAPVRVGTKDEKFLFYRGVGDFEVPITAVEKANGSILLQNVGEEPIPSVILFENRNGKMGFRRLDGELKGSAELAPVTLDADVESLRSELRAMILSAGMYAPEAEAMLATWNDSWFEEGARLFYLMPQSAVDAILPLHISPEPAEVSRAFVGRVELLTATTINTVARAIEEEDEATLIKYGRFLSPIVERMLSSATAETRRGAQREMTAMYDAHIKRTEAKCK